ncbi:hypothetical protein H4R33_005739 [Dimargaris cristalligena]|uniref:Uncharacterized protein n=1 Tax=Dimargaris cristalligena TaxID=215637 RepID=A0A4P9ZVL7_9FUNG|nr:hypothetical protein H4R33_005739 [Dimargaris cristalligena]RKP36981.1 hypothetical protein BJ085DRAFT_33596 [Dimargaris cristalligena]|eukprot:RKP36981.1 hypothetical protein BJ085DRAFT_33596 [Dimargaris cristalligena]
MDGAPITAPMSNVFQSNITMTITGMATVVFLHNTYISVKLLSHNRQHIYQLCFLQSILGALANVTNLITFFYFDIACDFRIYFSAVLNLTSTTAIDTILLLKAYYGNDPSRFNSRHIMVLGIALQVARVATGIVNIIYLQPFITPIQECMGRIHHATSIAVGVIEFILNAFLSLCFLRSIYEQWKFVRTRLYGALLRDGTLYALLTPVCSITIIILSLFGVLGFNSSALFNISWAIASKLTVMQLQHARHIKESGRSRIRPSTYLKTGPNSNSNRQSAGASFPSGHGGGGGGSGQGSSTGGAGSGATGSQSWFKKASSPQSSSSAPHSSFHSGEVTPVATPSQLEGGGFGSLAMGGSPTTSGTAGAVASFTTTSADMQTDPGRDPVDKKAKGNSEDQVRRSRSTLQHITAGVDTVRSTISSRRENNTRPVVDDDLDHRSDPGSDDDDASQLDGQTIRARKRKSHLPSTPSVPRSSGVTTRTTDRGGGEGDLPEREGRGRDRGRPSRPISYNSNTQFYRSTASSTSTLDRAFPTARGRSPPDFEPPFSWDNDFEPTYPVRHVHNVTDDERGSPPTTTTALGDERPGGFNPTRSTTNPLDLAAGHSSEREPRQIHQSTYLTRPRPSLSRSNSSQQFIPKLP